MRMYLSFILAVILLVALTACAADSIHMPSTADDTTVPTDGYTEPTHSAPTTVPTTAPSDEPDPIDMVIHTLDGTEEIRLTRVQTTIAEMPAEYSWTCYDGRIFLKNVNADCELGIIYGSDRYIYASFSSMTGMYCYLVDVQTGAVSDPLAALDAQLKERISEVVFSADGMYALIFSNSHTAVTLLNCATGQSQPLPMQEAVYSVSAWFVEQRHILISYCFEKEFGQFLCIFALYDISTGMYTSIPGEHQTKDPTADGFITITEQGLLYTFTSGQLSVIDPLTWEKTVYAFGSDATLSYYTKSTFLVKTEGRQYILHKDGTAKLITAQ